MSDDCSTCTGGAIRRRRANACSECGAGTYDAGNYDDCYTCAGGSVRRRRATSCTACPAGQYNIGDRDDCSTCIGAIRRRRANSCTDCGAGTYDAGSSDDCTACVGGSTTRRRSTTCTACEEGTYDPGASDDCAPCPGGAIRRRRADSCTDCAPGMFRNGTDDDCTACIGGSVRRRRAEDCTECAGGRYDPGDSDDCAACGGSVRRRRAESCTPCGFGYYKPDEGADECVETTTSTTQTSTTTSSTTATSTTSSTTSSTTTATTSTTTTSTTTSTTTTSTTTTSTTTASTTTTSTTTATTSTTTTTTASTTTSTTSTTTATTSSTTSTTTCLYVGVVWAESAGGPGDDWGSLVTFDPEGRLYVRGECGVTPAGLSAPASFGAASLRCARGQDLFLLSVGGAGEVQWARNQRRAADVLRGRALDASRSVYAASRAGGRAVVTKHRGSGAWEWSRVWGGAGDAGGTAVAVDAWGDVLAVGYFTGAIDVGGARLASAGRCATFLAKLSAAGDVLWSAPVQASDGGQVIGHGVAVDGSGNVFVTGRFDGTLVHGCSTLESAGSQDAFVVAFNGLGYPLGAKAVGGAGWDSGNSIASDGDGSLYVTGSFSEVASFDGVVLESRGSLDAFWMKLNHTAA